MMHKIPPEERHIVLVSRVARDLKVGNFVARSGRCKCSLEFLPVTAIRVNNKDQINITFEGPSSVKLEGDFDVWVVKEGYTR